MAKSKTAHLVPYQFQPGGGRAAAPIIIRERVAATSTKGKGKHRRHSGGGQDPIMHLAIAAWVMGKIDKDGTSIPTIPALGRAGTIAAAAHMFGKGKRGWVTTARNVALVVALYEMGSKGSISGQGVSGRL